MELEGKKKIEKRIQKNETIRNDTVSGFLGTLTTLTWDGRRLGRGRGGSRGKWRAEWREFSGYRSVSCRMGAQFFFFNTTENSIKL